MKPTNNLRFVKRHIPMHGDIGNYYGSVSREVYILQQMWESEIKVNATSGEVYTEWRDVPTEE